MEQLNNQDKIIEILENYKEKLLQLQHNSFLDFKLPRKDIKRPSKILLEDFDVTDSDVNYALNNEPSEIHLFSKNSSKNLIESNHQVIFELNSKKPTKEELKIKVKSVYDKALKETKETGVHSLFLIGPFLRLDLEINNKEKSLFMPLKAIGAEINESKTKIILQNDTEEDSTVNEQAKLFCKKYRIEFKDGYLIKGDKIGSPENLTCLGSFDSFIEYERNKPSFSHNSYTVIKAYAVIAEKNRAPILYDYMNYLDDYATSPLVYLFVGNINPEKINSEKKPKVEKEEENCCIIPSDSSQREIFDTISRTPSNGAIEIINIQGPPGSGKSQTIVNLLSNLYAKNKKVLVVAQKKVALDVIKERLKQEGLEHKVLEVTDIAEPKQKKDFYSLINSVNKIHEASYSYKMLNKEDEAKAIIANNFFNHEKPIDVDRKFMTKIQEDIDGYHQFLWTPLLGDTEFYHNDIISDIYSFDEYIIKIKSKNYFQQLLKIEPSILLKIQTCFKERFKCKDNLKGFNFIDNTWKDFNFEKYGDLAVSDISTEIDKIIELDSKIKTINQHLEGKTSLKKVPFLSDFVGAIPWYAFILYNKKYANILQQAELSLTKQKQVILSYQKNTKLSFETLVSKSVNEEDLGKIKEIQRQKQFLIDEIEFISNYFDSNQIDDLITDSLINNKFFDNLVSFVFENHKQFLLKKQKEFDFEKINKHREAYINLEKELLVDNKCCFVLANNNKSVDNYFKSISNREAERSRGHIPPHRFLKDFQTDLLNVCPLWVTTINSVSQILRGKKEIFDCVIFDEASQIEFIHAIPTLAKAISKVYVFGDNKQMPPTSFFKTSDVDENEEDEELNSYSVSLLDKAIEKSHHNFMLKWHYRSEKDSLIQFSNLCFYGGELKTIPSAHQLFEENAFEFHIVKDGVSSGGKNELEAKKTLDILYSTMQRYQGSKSIGIITFGSSQSSLIEDKIENKCLSDDDFQTLYSIYSSKEKEPLFIKNLENVQGDERDIIILSVTYGNTETGNPTSNFGPLNKEGGEFRLNVAISRSKYKMIIISSFDPHSRIIPQEKSISFVFNYLQYANALANKNEALYGSIVNKLQDTYRKNGVLGHWGKRKPSKWVKEIKEALEKLGYKVHFEVNPALQEISRFSIDLAVENPNKTGHFILGIECDGTFYHQHENVKDRDVVRENLLKSKGWNIVRISSDEWSTKENRIGVCNKLDKEINRLIALAVD